MALSPVETWPDLRVAVHLLPWAWQVRPSLYVDDVDGALGCCSFKWLFFHLEWWANRPMFTDREP